MTELFGTFLLFTVWAWFCVSPLCKHWGRSCELHLQEHVRLLGPSNSSARTLHDHSNSAPKRLLRLCTPAAHLCQCEAWKKRRTGGKLTQSDKSDIKYTLHDYQSLIIRQVIHLTIIASVSYIIVTSLSMWLSTWLSLYSLSCGHCSAGPNRNDLLPRDPHSHPQSLSDMWMAP